jgi:hypothetical protein
MLYANIYAYAYAYAYAYELINYKINSKGDLTYLI